MNTYLLIVFVHVAAAALLIGGSVVAAPAVRAAVRRAGSTQEMRALLAAGAPLAALNPVSSLLVLASGIYLATAGRVWALGWVQVATAFWLVNAVTAGAVVKPAIGRLAAELARAGDGPVEPRLEALRWSPRWSYGGNLLLANDTAMLFLMTVRPGLAGSLLAVAVANALVLALHLAGRRARAANAASGMPATTGPAEPQPVPTPLAARAGGALADGALRIGDE
jgi:uncharacterized membrane protein